jgi:hypothetical protein
MTYATKIASLAPALDRLSAATELLSSASVGNRTQRDDPRVHQAQALIGEAIQIAEDLGVPEVRLYQLQNERRSS